MEPLKHPFSAITAGIVGKVTLALRSEAMLHKGQGSRGSYETGNDHKKVTKVGAPKESPVRYRTCYKPSRQPAEQSSEILSP